MIYSKYNNYTTNNLYTLINKEIQVESFIKQDIFL